jgi:hypothetical protein
LNRNGPNQKQAVFQITDLCGNMVGNTYVNGGYYVNTSLYGAQNYPISSTCYDGMNFVVTPISGGICYSNNTNYNTNMNFDNTYNGTTMTSNIGGNVYASCWNGQIMVLGGQSAGSGNVITYNTLGTGTSSAWFASANANAIFGNVYGLASNSGYGPVYIPNSIYLKPSDKVSVIGPKAYDSKVSNNTTITLNLNL